MSVVISAMSINLRNLSQNGQFFKTTPAQKLSSESTKQKHHHILGKKYYLPNDHQMILRDLRF